MELPRKELTFSIQVIGTTIHQISETRGILTPDVLCTSPVHSVFLNRHVFQSLCAGPSFSLFLFLDCLLQPPNGSLSFQCHPSNRHHAQTELASLCCLFNLKTPYCGIRDRKTRLLRKCYFHTPCSSGCTCTQVSASTCSPFSTRPLQTPASPLRRSLPLASLPLP